MSGTIIRVPPTLLNSAGNHHQRKLQRLMGAIQVKTSSTQGTQSRLARAQARTVVPGEFTLCPRASSATGAPSTRPKPSSDRLRCEATLAKSPHQPTVSQAHSMQGSPDLGPRPQEKSPPRLTPGLGPRLGLGRWSPSRPTPGLGPHLGLGRWSPPRPTLGLGLNLVLGRWSPPRPSPGPGLNLDLRQNRVLARPRPRPQEESPPRPTLGSDRPRRRGYIITLPLASSGYGGTRPASHPGSPR
jgi:hypothetical protein